MQRTRPRVHFRPADAQANNNGYDADAAAHNVGADADDGSVDDARLYYDEPEYYDESEEAYDEAEAQPVGLFGTPARAITMVFSVLLLFVVTAVVAWIIGSPPKPGSGSAGTNTSGLPTAVKVGALAPDFGLNEIYSGKLLKLSSLRGKPVWVNFWASWCGPCKAEMPEMKQRYAKYKDKGLTILGVDDKEDNATVRGFIEPNGYDWTFVVDGDGSVLQQYMVSGIPTHLFLDKSGVIRYMIVGGITGEMMDDGLNKIMEQ